MEEYADADEVHKPYIYSTSDHFTLVLPDLTYEDGVLDATVTVLNYIPVPNGTKHDGKVLSFCYKRARKVAEIAAYLGMSDSTYLRKKVLENLEKNGYLIKNKISRATCYLTNPEMVDEN